MQRILPRGEIESLDRTKVPEVYLPDAKQVFAERAKRFKALAAGNPIAEYLLLMAHIAELQEQLTQEDGSQQQQLIQRHLQAQEQGALPLAPLLWQRDEHWLEHLHAIVQGLQPMHRSGESQQVLDSLQRALQTEPDNIEDHANAFLTHNISENVNLAWAPFIMGALQSYCTQLASALDTEALSQNASFGVCPCCGALPVASIVKMAGPSAGRRYAVCSLCSTQWHIVRVTCTHCESTKEISYHLIESGDEAIRAESCGQCGSYRKIFYQEKNPHVEALADDLASLELDLLMGQEGFYRINGNPFLWLPSEEQTNPDFARQAGS